MAGSSHFLPYGRQSVDEADIEAVTRVLRSDYLTTGPEVPRLEADLGVATGAKHVVGCANGTAALHLANMALGFCQDDSVIVPSTTFLATANAVDFTGAEVVFADVDPATGLITSQTLIEAASRATRRLRAAYVVHLGGQQPDMEDLYEAAQKLGIFLLEDASHAIGSRARTKSGHEWRVGETPFSTLATFSFHPVKTIAAGEGGAICTDDAGLAEKMSELRNHGMIRDPDRMKSTNSFDAEKAVLPRAYEMPHPGLNYRMSDIHAALLRSQLKKLDGFVKRRAELIVAYDKGLDSLDFPIQCVKRHQNQNPAWHLAQVLIDFTQVNTTKSAFSAELRNRGIGTQVHYLPVHSQSYYRDHFPDLSLPGADRFSAQTMSLPLYPNMKSTDQEHILNSIIDIFKTIDLEQL